MSTLSETQTFSGFEKVAANKAREVTLKVCAALKEKGYSPVNQIVGYILSGDPTYITSHRNARGDICALERDELLEELVTYYLKNNAENI